MDETRRWWRKIYRKFPEKGTDFQEEAAINFLRELAAQRVWACAAVVDLDVSADVAEGYQKDLLEPLLVAVDGQPAFVRKSLKWHLDHFLSFKPSTFVKAWTFLETMTDGVIGYLMTVGNKDVRGQDRRGLQIILDDQVAAACTTLQNFFCFFLYCRSHQGRLPMPDPFPKCLQHLVSEVNGRITVDFNRMAKICVADVNQEDKYVELKLADIITNFLRRICKGDFSPAAAVEMQTILKIVHPVHFDCNAEVVTKTVPDAALEQLKILGLIS